MTPATGTELISAPRELQPPPSPLPRQHKGKLPCSHKVVAVGASYQVVSTAAVAILCSLGIPEWGIAMGFAQCCCLFGYGTGNYDRKTQFKKELDRFADYLSALTHQQVVLKHNVQGLRESLLVANEEVVKKGFGQLLELKNALGEVEDSEENIVAAIIKSLDEVVNGQTAIFQGLKDTGATAVAFELATEEAKSATKELDEKLTAIIQSREEEGAHLMGTMNRLKQLRTLQMEGITVMNAIELVLGNLQGTNARILASKEKMEATLKELTELNKKAEDRGDKYKAGKAKLAKEMQTLRQNLAEAQCLVKENKDIVTYIRDLAEKFGGMDALALRIERAVSEQDGVIPPEEMKR
jgi:chromosome segregation ATPase